MTDPRFTDLARYLASMGEPPSSVSFLLAHPALVPDVRPLNPPCDQTGD